jgi:dipeptidyl aminopeptidase/acylaminoacyl peptidase
LPTLAHWQRAAGTRDATLIAFSNFSNKGPAAAGTNHDIGPYGTYQMAGNVKEWASTTVGDLRYILGGAWNEATYMAVQPDARAPFDRSNTNGVRCVKYLTEPPANVFADVARPDAAITPRTPVPDAEFALYQRLYGYDQTALAARIETTEETEHWRRERVSFAAAYGNERVVAQVYLPKNAVAPYQAVIWFGGGDVLELPSSDHPGTQFLFDFVIRTGRAVVLPVFKGTFERRSPPPAARGRNAQRELGRQRSNDLGRTIDYLETRPDIDRTRVAYYALSFGATNGLLLVPLEPRVKAAVLLATGLSGGTPAPERDPVNFAPRLRVPTLMINGHDDFLFLVDSQQKPLFELLGAPRDRKKHVVLEGVGHMPPPRADVIREVLAWFDTYLGAVERR